MKNKLLVFLSVVFAALYLQSSVQQDSLLEETTKKNKEEGGLIASFIRMDLLRAEKKSLPPAKRSIFTPGRSVARSSDSEASQEEIERIEIAKGIQKRQAAEYLDLRYIGYVRSGKKIVALVVFQGEPLAVTEGEMIEEKIMVRKIGLEEIEVTGPDSKSSTFSLEGELP